MRYWLSTLLKNKNVSINNEVKLCIQLYNLHKFVNFELKGEITFPGSIKMSYMEL